MDPLQLPSGQAATAAKQLRSVEVSAASNSTSDTPLVAVSSIPSLPTAPKNLEAVSPSSVAQKSRLSFNGGAGGHTQATTISAASVTASELQSMIEKQVAAAVSQSIQTHADEIASLRSALQGSDAKVKEALSRAAAAEAAAHAAAAQVAAAQAAAAEAAAEAHAIRKQLDSAPVILSPVSPPAVSPPPPGKTAPPARSTSPSPAADAASPASPYLRGKGMGSLKQGAAGFRSAADVPRPASMAEDPTYRTPQRDQRGAYRESELPSNSKSVRQEGGFTASTDIAADATLASLRQQLASCVAQQAGMASALTQTQQEVRTLHMQLGDGITAAVEAKVTARLGPVPPKAMFSSLQQLQAQVAYLAARAPERGGGCGGVRGQNATALAPLGAEEPLKSASQMQTARGSLLPPLENSAMVLADMSAPSGGGQRHTDFALRAQAHSVMRTVLGMSATIESLTADVMAVQDEITALTAETHSTALGMRALAGDVQRQGSAVSTAVNRMRHEITAASMDLHNSSSALRAEVHSRLQSSHGAATQGIAAVSSMVASLQSEVRGMEDRLAGALSKKVGALMQGEQGPQQMQAQLEALRSALAREVEARVRSERALNKAIAKSAASAADSGSAGGSKARATLRLQQLGSSVASLEAKLEAVAAQTVQATQAIEAAASKRPPAVPSDAVVASIAPYTPPSNDMRPSSAAAPAAHDIWQLLGVRVTPPSQPDSPPPGPSSSLLRSRLEEDLTALGAISVIEEGDDEEPSARAGASAAKPGQVRGAMVGPPPKHSSAHDVRAHLQKIHSFAVPTAHTAAPQAPKPAVEVDLSDVIGTSFGGARAPKTAGGAASPARRASNQALRSRNSSAALLLPQEPGAGGRPGVKSAIPLPPVSSPPLSRRGSSSSTAPRPTTAGATASVAVPVLWSLAEQHRKAEQETSNAATEDISDIVGFGFSAPSKTAPKQHSPVQEAVQAAQSAKWQARPELQAAAGALVTRMLQLPPGHTVELQQHGLVPLVASGIAALLQVQQLLNEQQQQQQPVQSGNMDSSALIKRLSGLEESLSALQLDVSQGAAGEGATADKARVALELDALADSVGVLRRKVSALERDPPQLPDSAVQDVVDRAIPLVVTAATDEVVDAAMQQLPPPAHQYEQLGTVLEEGGAAPASPPPSVSARTDEHSPSAEELKETLQWLDGSAAEEAAAAANAAPPPSNSLIGTKRDRSARAADLGPEHVSDASSQPSTSPRSASGSSSSSSSSSDSSSSTSEESSPATSKPTTATHE